MYAPKLRDMTREERWQEALNYRIDCMAQEALAEIKRMADEAREALCQPEPKDERIVFDPAGGGLAQFAAYQQRALESAQFSAYLANMRMNQQQSGGYAYVTQTSSSPLRDIFGDPFRLYR